MNEVSVIAITIFGIVFFLAVLVYFGFQQSLRLREKAMMLEHRVRLDQFRSHMERDVMQINKDFSSSMERFEELNHLPLSGQSDIRNLSNARPKQSEYLRAHGIELSHVPLRLRTIFLLTPFHEDFDGFTRIVGDVGRETGYLVSRGDERVEKSDIFHQILLGIVSSRFIVANITGRNPNVFYELGLAHALDKEVILIAEGGADIPFDLQSKRIIFYDDLGELRFRLLQAIARLGDV